MTEIQAVTSDVSSALVLHGTSTEDIDNMVSYQAPAADRVIRKDIGALLEAAGAAFKVSCVQSFLSDGTPVQKFAGYSKQDDGTMNAKFKPLFQVVREDHGTSFQQRSEHYTPLQSVDSLDIMQPVVDSGMGEYDGVLILNHGALIVVRYKMMTIQVTGDRSPINCYLQLVCCHDSKVANSIYESTIRAICMNTLNAGIRQAKGKGKFISIRHTKNAAEKVEVAKQVIGQAANSFAFFNAKANFLASQKMTLAEMNKMAVLLMPSSKEKDGGEVATRTANRRAELVHLFANGTGIEGDMQGTRWAAVNAVSEYTSSVCQVKGDDKQAARDYSMRFGPSYNLQVQAMEYLEVQGELV